MRQNELPSVGFNRHVEEDKSNYLHLQILLHQQTESAWIRTNKKMDESRCMDVSRQSRGRKRSRSLENNPGERRESRASSVASVSSDAKYNRERTGASQGIISPAAHTKYSGKNPVASYKIIPSEPSELDTTYFEELAAYSSEAASIATRKHQCQICGQRYRKLSSLEIHISRHEGQKRMFTCSGRWRSRN